VIQAFYARDAAAPQTSNKQVKAGHIKIACMQTPTLWVSTEWQDFEGGVNSFV
jgi:hypothetical protein